MEMLIVFLLVKTLHCLFQHTAYLGTSNSGSETRDRARLIAEQMGTFHLDCTIDDVVEGLKSSYRASIRSVEAAVLGKAIATCCCCCCCCCCQELLFLWLLSGT
jgi:hypothetical protein